MTDLITRLRTWSYARDAAPVSDLMDEAAAEIERLRNGAVGSRETVQLSDAEREAIADAADRYAEITPESAETAATLRGLLDRMK